MKKKRDPVALWELINRSFDAVHESLRNHTAKQIPLSFRMTGLPGKRDNFSIIFEIILTTFGLGGKVTNRSTTKV